MTRETRATLCTLHPMTPECAEQSASRRATVCIFKTTTCVVGKPERVGVTHTILEEYTVEVTSASQCMQAKARFGTELASDQSLCGFPGAQRTAGDGHGARVRRGGLDCDPSERRDQDLRPPPVAPCIRRAAVGARQRPSTDTAGRHHVDPRRPVSLRPPDASRCSQDQVSHQSRVFGRLARLRLHPTMRRRGRA